MAEPAPRWSFSKRCFWLTLACLVLVWQGPSFIRGLRPDQTASRVEIFDFFQDWASARNYFAGLPVYGPQEDALKQYLNSTRDPRDPRNRFFNEVNAHPPAAVLCVLPFARMEYPTAFLVWSLLSLLLGGASLWLVVRHLHLAWSPWSLLPVITLLLVCNPFRQQMHEGQWSLTVLFCLTGTWAAARSGRATQAGVLLAAATAIKLIPGLLFVHFAWRREWKTVGVGLATLVLLTGLSVAVLGVEDNRTYVVETIPSLQVHNASWANASPTGFWTRLLGEPNGRFWHQPLWPSPPLARSAIFFSTLVLCAAWLWSLRRVDQDQGFGLTVVVMLLIAPVTWEHYFLWLLIPLTVLRQRSRPSGSTGRLAWPMVVVLWIQPRWLWQLAIPGGWLSGTAVPWQSLTVLSAQFYALVGLFVLMLMHEPRQGQSLAPDWHGEAELTLVPEPETTLAGH